MRVAETFGPTVQGEGPSTGTPATFVRLWGCNRDCTWCDTPYTWDTKGKNGTIYVRDQESTDQTAAEVIDGLPLAPLLVITGGEPLIQANAVAELIDAAIDAGFERVEIETNGTRRPLDPDPKVHYNVSPKLASAQTTKPGIIPEVLAEFAERDDSVFKFVACSVDDFTEIDAVVEASGMPSERVYVMPEGTTADTIEAGQLAITQAVIARDYNLSTRLHVLLWGDKRGV